MTENIFTGNAVSIRDVWKLVIGGTWAPNDYVTLTVGDVKGLTTTFHSDVSLANIILALKNSWMSGERLSGDDTPDATSDFGGQEFGEFSEMSAEQDGVHTLTLTGTTPGKPVSVTVFAGSASGTVTLTNPQPATGQNHYDNGLNWSLGVVPTKAHVLVLQNSNVSIKYGLPNNSPMPEVIQRNSWTGTWGLTEVNVDNPNKPYTEYRQGTGRFNDATAGPGTGNRVHTFGLGAGPGSPMIKMDFRHEVDGKSSVNVYGTADAPLEPNGNCLNLGIFNTFTDPGDKGSVNVFKGSVCVTDASEVNFVSVSANASCNVLIVNPAVNITVLQTGGQVRIQQTRFSDINHTLSCLGGVMTCDGLNVDLGDGDTVLLADDGRIVWNTDGAFTSLVVSGAGVFDAEQDVRPFAGTAVQLFQGAGFLDKYGRGSYTTGPDFVRCDVNDLEAFRIGQNKRILISSI